MDQYQKLKLDRNCIYIYNEFNLEVIIHSADGEIVSESLLQPAGSGSLWSLFCLTDLGHVYRVVNKQAKTVQRKSEKDNHEIFSDLLSDEGKEDEFGVSVQLATRPVYILQPRDLILTVGEKAVGLCVINDMLSVVIDNVREYSTYVYEISEQFQGDISVNKQAKIIKILKRSSHLPEKEKTCGTVLKAAVLVDGKENLLHSTDQMLLAESLFKELFGKDVLMLNIPVMLLCVPEGAVYFASAKSFVFHDPEELGNEAIAPIVGANMSTDVGWNLLCETATQVVDILQVPLEEGRTVEGSVESSAVTYEETMVLCCESGLVLVYFADKLCQTGTIMSEIVLTSPLVALSSFQNKLYHSTAGQIYETSLLVKSDARDGKPIVAVSKTKMFKYAGITSVLSTPMQGYISHQDTPCTLTCATSHGQIKDIKSTEFGDDVAMVTGSQIRDVLMAMDKVDAEKKKVQKVLQEQDHLLQQVNIAVNLNRWNLLNAPPKTAVSGSLQEQSEKSPFSCSTTARLYSAYGGMEIQLNVEIANKIGVNLSCDWRFVMRLLPCFEIMSQKGIDSVSQSLKEDFKPKDSFSLTVGVKPDLVLLGFTVSVAAMLCIKDNFDWLEQAKLSSDWPKGIRCLSAPIYSEEIDVLYFLMPNTYESKQHCLRKDTTGDIGRNILKIAETKPMWNLYKESIDKEPTSSTTLCLAHGFHMLENTYRQLQDKYGKGLCSILRYLLHDSTSVSPPAGTDCSAITMLGQAVYLSVSSMAAVSLETVETEVSAVHVEVKVRSEASTAAAVHDAVVRRMKPLENDACRPLVPVRELKKRLHQLQELQDDVQTVSSNKGSQEDAVKLISLYERLRSVQLA